MFNVQALEKANTSNIKSTTAEHRLLLEWIILDYQKTAFWQMDA